MFGAAVVIQEMTGRLDHDIGRDLTPGQRLGMALGAEADAAPVDQQMIAVDRDVAQLDSLINALGETINQTA